VITSGCAPFYDAAGKLLISAALENVIVWNVKQGSQVGAALVHFQAGFHAIVYTVKLDWLLHRWQCSLLQAAGAVTRPLALPASQLQRSHASCGLPQLPVPRSQLATQMAWYVPGFWEEGCQLLCAGEGTGRGSVAC
jgi:hypothetical protein